jgi:hypothetical protein
MVKTTEGIGNNVLLTITDRKGNVVFHETVKVADVEIVSSRILAHLR